MLVSTYAADGKRQWLHEKLMAVSLTPHPQVKGLAYHHGAYNGYWTEPQATVNPDFTRVLFNSNWARAAHRHRQLHGGAAQGRPGLTCLCRIKHD